MAQKLRVSSLGLNRVLGTRRHADGTVGAEYRLVNRAGDVVARGSKRDVDRFLRAAWRVAGACSLEVAA